MELGKLDIHMQKIEVLHMFIAAYSKWPSYGISLGVV
jgi:hypothetical protein